MLVVGARQVGKTYIIKEFIENEYRDSVYINLEESPDFLSIFEDSLKPSEIIRNIEILLGRRIDIENTCIFIDEIQKSEKAINSLKYFCEDKINYRIIGAGSLLGVKLHRFESSFPVGKVIIKHMYPMCFEEFLCACGEDLLLDSIISAYKDMKPLPNGIHEKAIKLYTDYLFVGGMPSAVSDYLKNEKDALSFNREIHRNLITSYLADMTKYTFTPSEGIKIVETYESLPRQLAKENPKFKYSTIREFANKRDFESSIDWLTASQMAIKSISVNSVRSPLKVYENTGIFKLYLSDVGLLCTLSGMQYKDLLSDEHNLFKGAVTENYVIQEMHCKGVVSHYFKPDQNMEIDELIEEDGVVPIEIKSGRHKRSTSLKNYIEKYEPKKHIDYQS